MLVARCWQYQRERESASDLPETWVLADALVDAALASLPDSAFENPAEPRSSGNLAGRDSLAWDWRR
ncbi:hypothetical protein CCE01nite_17570 [Cellulomonas cellasea]|uniref:Uncharacterized protein n=1 Tax=Cellulomonas cellasea TaxID=43670 RepID=A0A4Y3KY99_9CELL|nr:hypothetical protein CCE01nite_17570 [Cellulomonas cellasea]